MEISSPYSTLDRNVKYLITLNILKEFGNWENKSERRRDVCVQKSVHFPTHRNSNNKTVAKYHTLVSNKTSLISSYRTVNAVINSHLKNFQLFRWHRICEWYPLQKMEVSLLSVSSISPVNEDKYFF